MKSCTETNNFDVIRNVLAFLVFFTHWNILTSSGHQSMLFHLSGIAIDMFFVVSGFLIWWSYSSDRDSINFYLKRFFRVFPLYFFVISTQTVFFIFQSSGSCADIVKYFSVNIVFLNFLAPSVGDILGGLNVNAINGSLWTLKNEVFFYISVPLIYKAYKLYGIKILWFIYSLSVIYLCYFYYINDETMLVQFPAQIRLFLSGIFAYIFFDKFGRFYPHLVGLSCLLVALLFRNDIVFKIFLYPLALSAAVIYCAYYLRVFSIRFDFSYSFYIFHFPLIQLAIYYDLNPSNQVLSILSLFFITVFLSYLSELFIEKRFVNVGRRMIIRRKEKIASH